MSELAWFVGIDQGPEEHMVVVVERTGKRVGERKFVHDGAGLAELARWIEATTGGLERVAVGTETPRGAVVSLLVGLGVRVFAINPKKLDRFRDRHSVAGAKSDPLDAYVLGDSLRNDRHCYREVELISSWHQQLQHLRRLQGRVDKDLRRATSQLWAILQEVWPSLLKLSPAADERWLWALLERAATPQKAQRLQRRTLARILDRHRIRRFDVERLRERLQEPILELAPGTMESREVEIAMLTPRLQLLDRQSRECERRLEKLLAEAPRASEASGPTDVELLDSMPGLGAKTAAALLAEASHALTDHRHLRLLAGAAPVTESSGRRHFVSRRLACNVRLAQAVYRWIDSARKSQPDVAARYARLRARGHTHGRAIRQTADTMLRIVAAILRDRRLYDPERLQPSPGTP